MTICPVCGSNFELRPSRPTRVCCSKKCSSLRWKHNHRSENLACKHAWNMSHAVELKRRRDNDKMAAFEHYAGCHCSWPGCTITDPDMLEIDHINNDGAKHRKETGHTPIHRWLKNNSYPPGFQVLCGGHNQKKKLMLARGEVPLV